MQSAVAVALYVDAPIAESFSLELRRRLRDGHGVFMWTYLPQRARFAALKLGPRAVLAAVSARWQIHDNAYPSCERIAADAGCRPSAVRLHIAALERAGWLVVQRSDWRQRRANGKADTNRYSPGPVLLEELAAWAPPAQDKRAKTLGPVKTTATPRRSAPQPEFGCGPQPEFGAEVITTKSKRSSSSALEHPASSSSPPEQEQGSSISTAEDRGVARDAVEARLARAYPGLRPTVDAHELELAAACAAAVLGGLEVKREALADALEGAWLRSTGTPRGVYVWGRLEHFAQHRDAGRVARLSRERARAPRQASPAADVVEILSLAQSADVAGEIVRMLRGAS
jgi:hypothetical protein